VLRILTSGFRVQGSVFRVEGAGCRVQGSGFRVQCWVQCSVSSVQCSRFWVLGSGFSVQCSVFRFQGSGIRVQGSGFRVEGFDPWVDAARTALVHHERCMLSVGTWSRSYVPTQDRADRGHVPTLQPQNGRDYNLPLEGLDRRDVTVLHPGNRRERGWTHWLMRPAQRSYASRGFPIGSSSSPGNTTIFAAHSMLAPT